jgi:hypothetical protein
MFNNTVDLAAKKISLLKRLDTDGDAVLAFGRLRLYFSAFVEKDFMSRPGRLSGMNRSAP